MAMSKRSLFAVTFISVLLVSMLAGVQPFKVAKAESYQQYLGEGPAPPDTTPPEISIFAPQNCALYASNIILLNATVSLLKSRTSLLSPATSVYYQGDWQNESVLVSNNITADFSFSLNLTGVPDGNPSLTVYAFGGASYFAVAGDKFGEYSFSSNSSSTVLFSTHSAPPNIAPATESSPSITPSQSPIPSPASSPSLSILSPANNSVFGDLEVNGAFPNVTFPLVYLSNSTLSWVGYSIYGESNITLPENGTTVSLGNYPDCAINGNLTLYANDASGNWATPYTIFFNVAPHSEDGAPTPTPKPQSGFLGTSLQAEYGYAIVVAGVIIVVAGLSLFYSKKRRKS